MARILVVDDQAENRALLSYLLGYYGHEVTTASDGAKAVQAALAEPPDLIVMDIAMPGTDGYTAARMIRSEQALTGVSLIAVSATGAVTTQRAQAAGFDAYYQMPIDPGEFVNQLGPYLGRPRAAGDAAR